ncbi:MAG TPA: hypothetical protein VEJ40_06545 [Pseudolabrys sp.]|jgi:hypothetical protein|nr:hypothetical protein [Pseudolabrys sp.]
MSWRNLGSFLLLVVLCMVISPAVGVIAIYAVDAPIRGLLGGSSDAVGLAAAALGSLVGTSLAVTANVALMDERPARGVGAAFVVLQAAYTVMTSTVVGNLKFAGLLTDPLFVQSLAACVAVWIACRLPPLRQPRPLTPQALRRTKITAGAGVAVVVVIVFAIIAVSH